MPSSIRFVIIFAILSIVRLVTCKGVCMDRASVIPPTGVGGWLKFDYVGRASPIPPTAVGRWLKSDSVGRASRIPPTAVGGWLSEYVGRASPIPPTAVGGWLKSDLQAAATLLNPPNGSWGMVNARPLWTGASAAS